MAICRAVGLANLRNGLLAHAGRVTLGQVAIPPAGGSFRTGRRHAYCLEGAAMAESRSVADSVRFMPPLRDAGWLEVGVSRAFAALPDQVAAARGFLSEIMGDAPARDDAVVCLSELMTNSLLHSRSGLAGGRVAVHVCQFPDRWRVGVTDDGGPWHPHHAGGSDGLSSRGLVIVAELASGWQVEPFGRAGRLVWFEISDQRV
jgi:histidine kinase-like protein